MGTLVTLRIVRLTAFVCLLVAILWLVLARGGAVQAAGVVTICSNDSDLIAKLGGGGLVTFNCPLPAPVIITVTVSGGIVVTANTTLDGSNNGNPITLSGGGSTRLFHHLAAGSTLTLTHLTLRDGNAGSANGGCLFNESGTAVLVDVTVTGCKGAVGFLGGGIYNNGTAMLTGVTLSGNSAGFGGGIFNNGGTATLSNVTLSGNSAGFGGGIFNQGTATLSNVTLSGNSASIGGGGGGIWNAGTATLTNVTLIGNSAVSDGAGILNGGTATLNHSTLSGNSAARCGGGIWNAGTATLNNSTLSASTAITDGGGIDNSGTAMLNHSTLSGNSAMKRGGGIYNDSFGTATLDHSTLSGNSASIGGGGIYNNSSAAATLNDTTLSDNSAGNNGAGLNNSGTATLINSTLSGNLATHWGGGIYNLSRASLWNVTLSNNSAASGGALYIATGVTTVLTNTVLAYSPAGGNCGGPGTISDSKYSISSDKICTLSGTGNLTNTDPLLTALGNYGGPTLVHMLKLGSPAIDGVVGSDAPATDQRGFPRPQGAGFDIGAVERQPTDSDLAPRLFLPLIER